jgi:hypothetical protein
MRRNFLKSLAAVTASVFCLKPSVAKQTGVITTMIHGRVVHYARDGKLFKIEADDVTHWFQNGNLHREDGPAAEYKNGHKAWYRNGKLHREDGPAVEHINGDKFWYIEDKMFKAEIRRVPCEPLQIMRNS